MRVTKVIREYVEREIGAKFDPLISDAGREYQEMQNELQNRLNELAKRTEEEADRIAAELGFLPGGRYGRSVSISSYNYDNKEKRVAYENRRNELVKKKTDAVENILLNLELGETTKAELRDAIESVTV